MLATGLRHLESESDIAAVLGENRHVLIVCGRMGSVCRSVYATLEELSGDYPHVAFCDLDFDLPAAGFIQYLPACRVLGDLPFMVYFCDDEVVAATGASQDRAAIRAVLDREFGPTA